MGGVNTESQKERAEEEKMGTLLRDTNNITKWHIVLFVALVALVSATLLLAMPDPALAPWVRW